MAIPLRGTVKSGTATNGNDVTLTFDAGADAPQTDDIVLVFGGFGNDNSSSVPAAPVTSGYTERVAPVTNTQVCAGFWYKVMGATPDTNVVCEGGEDTGNGVAYVAIVLDGDQVDAAIFDNTDVLVNNSTANAACNPGAITVNTLGAWVIAFGASNITDTSPGVPSNYTQLGTPAGANDSDDLSVTAVYREMSGTGSEDPGAFTGWANAPNIAITIVIKPASAAPLASDDILIRFGPGITTTIGSGLVTPLFTTPAVAAPTGGAYYHRMMQHWFSNN